MSNLVTRVLIVDDSAFARKVLREMLASAPLVDVAGVARDGEEALRLVDELRPDIVICDLMMPKMNGVEFVRRQMALRPVPILIVSAAAENAAEVLDALSAGATDVVQKPSALANDDLRKIRDELVEKVRGAMGAPVQNLTLPVEVPPSVPIPRQAGHSGVIVLGISTGGPQALRRIIPRLPSDLPVPVAIVLHMPVGYTALYADKLNSLCALEIKEAADGDEMRPGRVLLAPAGRHLVLRRNPAGAVVAQLTMHPLEKLHRPSVDVLFQSAAETYGSRVLAVVMTGMGDDGTEGAGWVKAQGGRVLTESEKSCVIYGMPRSVVEAGLSDAAYALDDMVPALLANL